MNFVRKKVFEWYSVRMLIILCYKIIVFDVIMLIRIGIFV